MYFLSLNPTIMKSISITAATMLLIVACHSTKKSTTAVSTATPGSSSVDPSGPASSMFPVPGDPELIAIHKQYDKNVSLDNLKEGYALYTGFTCTQCHSAPNFYKYQLNDWVGILDNMALRAHISVEQKNSIHQYVVAARLVKTGKL